MKLPSIIYISKGMLTTTKNIKRCIEVATNANILKTTGQMSHIIKENLNN